MEKFRVLSVLRHGEAEIGVGKAGDFSRNLSEFGKHQIGRLNLVLRNNGFKFDCLVSSPALRACQTAELISKDFEHTGIKIEKDIYEAEPEDLIKIIHKVDEKVDNLLLIGHNPGVSALISFITGEGYVSLRPGMMAIVDVYVDDWSLLGQDSGVLREIWQ